jgi:hypothetical protein
MRIHFSTQKRVSNLARRFRRALERHQVTRSDDQLREAVAIASGYRNHNELLKKIATDGHDSPADEDMDPGEAHERARSFAEKLAVELDVDKRILFTICDEISPFSGASFAPRISDEQIEWIAANLTRLATTTSPTAPDDSRKADWPGFELTIRGTSYRLCVSEEGEIWQSDSETLAELLWAGRIAHVDKQIDEIGPSNVHIHTVLKRLDRRALFALRGAHRYSEACYSFAKNIPDGSAWLRSLAASPRLGRALARKIDTKREYEVDLADPDPMRSVVDDVIDLSSKTWPTSDVTTDRAALITKRYMAVSTAADGYAPIVPAFLMHLPDDVQPKTALDYEMVEDFLYRNSSIFEGYSLGLKPASFGEEMRRAYGSDWSKVDQRSWRTTLSGTELGAAVAAQAAREAGYQAAVSGEFEEPEEERCAELLFRLGCALIAERNLSYHDGVLLLKKVDAHIEKSVDETMAKHEAGLTTSDEEDVAQDESYYSFLAENAFHSRHRGKRALDILEEHKIDIHEIVSDAADYGSPLYERRGVQKGPEPTSVSTEQTHRIHITVKWRDPRKRTSGSSSIAVTLPKALDEIIKVSRYQYSAALCAFSRLGPGLLQTEQSLEHDLDPVDMACAAARALQFMAATNLVPSKRNAHLGRVGGEFPALDHWATWTDKATGAKVVTSEPYSAFDDGSYYAQWADSNGSVVVVSNWAGMYMPGASRLILITATKNAAMLEAMEEQLGTLEDPIIKGNCEHVDGPRTLT